MVTDYCSATAWYHDTAAGGGRWLKHKIKHAPGRSSSFGKADHDIHRMGSMASRTLTELDFCGAEQDSGEPANPALDPVGSQIPYLRMG